MCITPLFSYTQQKMHRQCTTYSHIDSTVPSRDSSLSPSFDSATSTTLVSESLPHTLFSGWNTSCQPYAGIRMEGVDDWLGASVPSHGSSLPWYYVSGAMAYNGCQLSGDMAHDSFTTGEDDWLGASAPSHGSSLPLYQPSGDTVCMTGEDDWLGASAPSHGSFPPRRSHSSTTRRGVCYVTPVREEGMDDWLGASAPSHGSSLPWYYASSAVAYNEAGALAPGYTWRHLGGAMAYNEAGALAPGYTRRHLGGAVAYNEAGALAPGYTWRRPLTDVSHRFRAGASPEGDDSWYGDTGSEDGRWIEIVGRLHGEEYPTRWAVGHYGMYESWPVGAPETAICASLGPVMVPRSPRIHPSVSVHILLTHNLNHVGLGYVDHARGVITITEFCKPLVHTNEFAVALDIDMLNSLPTVRDPFNRAWTLSPVMAWHTNTQALRHNECLAWAATYGGAVDCKHYVAGAFRDLCSSFVASFYSSDPVRSVAVYQSLRCDVAPTPDLNTYPYAPNGYAQVPNHPPLYIDGIDGAKYIVHPQVMAVWTAHANQLHHMVQTQQGFSMNLCQKYNNLLSSYQVTCAELERTQSTTEVDGPEHHAQTMADQAKQILVLESQLKEHPYSGWNKRTRRTKRIGNSGSKVYEVITNVSTSASNSNERRMAKNCTN